MRILVITHQYPRPGHEGIADYNRQQFAALAADHDVHVIAPVPWPAALTDSVRRSRSLIPRFDGRINVAHPIYYYPPRMLEHRYGQFYYQSIRRYVTAEIDRLRPEVILSCWSHPDGWAALQLGRAAGVPVVIKVIGSDVLTLGRQRLRGRRVAQALRQSDAVVAVSHDLAQHVMRMGVTPERTVVVPEGIDTSLFTPGDRRDARVRLGLPSDDKILLFVGNLLLSKGADILVEACRLLAKRGIGFSCYFLGEGRHRHKIQRLIVRYRLDKQVHLMGRSTHRSLPDWYRSSDVVALPSFSEGIPNVLREALACGKPFIATRVGGIPEIADSSYSRLIEAGDYGALADAIASTLEAPPIIDPRKVQQHNITWQRSAELLSKVLLEAAALGRRGPTRVGITGDGSEMQSGAGGHRATKVIAITQHYPRPAHEGIAPYNRQQFRELARQCDLRVISPLPWREVFADWLRLDMRPRRYRNRDGIWVENPCFYYPPRVSHHRHGDFLLRSIRATAERLYNECRPDVILGSWAYPDGWAAVRLAQEMSLPVVIKVHGSDVLVLGRDPLRRRLVAEVLQRADKIVAVSRDLAEHVATMRVSRDKIHVVLNGIDREMFCAGDRTVARNTLGVPLALKMILFVGNIVYSKGLEFLVEACDELRRVGYRFRCYLVGEGRNSTALRRFIHNKQLEQHVVLVGGVVHENLCDWFRACNVFALPSLSEGSPNVLREALACGRPFVATNVGGIPEIAHHSFSRLVKPRDSIALAGAIAEMMDASVEMEPSLIDSRLISWCTSAERLAQILRSAAGRRES